MRYRAKLFLTFFGLAMIATLLALTISYAETYTFLMGQLRTYLLGIATSSATFIDGNAVDTFTAKSEESPAYQGLKSQLQTIQEASFGSLSTIRHMYIIKPNRAARSFQYVLDTSNIAVFGNFFPADPSIFQNFDHPFVDPNYTYDHWGKWLSAYAPIRNSSGAPIALLGVDISATVVQAQLERLLLFGAISLVLSILISLLIAHFFSKIITQSLSQIVNAIENIATGDLSYRIHLKTNDEFADLADTLNSMTKAIQQQEKLKLGFARYVSHYVLDRILKSEILTQMQGERRKVTVLFSDIRGFTHLSEVLPPEEVVNLLNEYFERMIAIIFKYNGTLDKLIGDGIMAEFGAPLEDENQEKHSVLAALDMLTEVEELNKHRSQEKKVPIKIGIGIHTGFAIVGNVGSEERMDYTAIGDCVNVAARLEERTKDYNKPIIISYATYEAVKETIPCDDLGDIALPGREEVIHAYAVRL